MPQNHKNLFPHLHLLVSGGNSQIILLQGWQKWSIVGQTLDDAAGECLDKIARMLGLPYPGGVYMAKIAKLEEANWLNFPVGMNRTDSLDYSFSGLKTSVRYFLQKQTLPDFQFEKSLSEVEMQQLLNYREKYGEKVGESAPQNKLDLVYQTCVCAQTVVMQQLVRKFEKAILKFGPQTIGLSGGVSASLLLRQKIQILKGKHSLSEFFLPPLALTGDNAVMIALAGLANIQEDIQEERSKINIWNHL